VTVGEETERERRRTKTRNQGSLSRIIIKDHYHGQTMIPRKIKGEQN